MDINSDVEMDVIEALHIPPRLQQLELYIIHKNWYPTWLLSSVLDNLRHLVFSCGCDSSFLPPFWKLKSLEMLEITNNPLLECLDLDFFGISDEKQIPEISSAAAANNHFPFPKLTRLIFKSCENWEEWEDVTAGCMTQLTLAGKTTIMPCLRELVIEDCSKLEQLPLSILEVSKKRGVSFEGFIIESYEDYERVLNERDTKRRRLQETEEQRRNSYMQMYYYDYNLAARHLDAGDRFDSPSGCSIC